MAGLDFAGKQKIMTELVQNLAKQRNSHAEPSNSRILAHLDDIHSVADMAKVASVSPRQLSERSNNQQALRRTIC